MALSVVDTAVSASATDITTHTISLPAGAAGNMLLIILAFDGDPVPDWTASPGYTQVWIGEANTNDAICEVRYRVCDGSEGTTISVDSALETQKMAAVVYEISGHDGTAPQAGTSVAGTTETPNPPLVTPSGGAKEYLWIVLTATDGLTTVDAYPTDYGNGVNQQSGGGTGQVTLNVARRLLNASSEDPGTFDLNVATEQTVAQTIVVSPGSDTGGMPVVGPGIGVWRQLTGVINGTDD